MLIIQTTFDSKKEAQDISLKLLEKSLVSCTQISKIESRYIWDNEIQTQKEFLLTIKLDSKNLKKVKKLLHKLHSYEVPQFIVLKPKKVSKKYKKWIKNY